MSSQPSIPSDPAAGARAGARRAPGAADSEGPIGEAARLEYRRALGAHLRELRKQRGLTQRELERKAGLTKNLVGRLERGEGSVGVDCVLPLAAALGVQPGELFPPGPETPGTASDAAASE